MLKLAIIAPALFGLQPAVSTPRGDAIAPEQTICEATIRSGAENGVKATLVAEFISDRIEQSLLKDENCPQVVVIPYDGPDTIQDEGYKAFSRILDASPLQVGLLTARVKVYGTLRRENSNRYRLDAMRYIEIAEQNDAGAGKPPR